MNMWKMALLGMILAGSAAQAGTLAPGLLDQMQDLQDTDILKVLVVMESRADTRNLDKSLHEQGLPLPDRHRLVVADLQAAARADQGNLVAELDRRFQSKSQGRIIGYTPHWIVNGIVLVAEVGVIRELAQRNDVRTIEPELVAEPITPVMVKAAVDPGEFASPQGVIAQGINIIRAPQVWYELGITGAGRLVAGMDSGVDASHPALADRWRGNFAPAAECWQDVAGAGSPGFPVDTHGHGSHTMGTMVGASATDTVGVAPGALWIASNAIFTSGDLDIAVIAAFEFFTDPDGNPETFADVPDVVQNSWGVREGPGSPYLPCDSTYWEVIDNCEAAGVVVIWSAGNEGPDPESLRSPGNRASSPTNCFAVGSIGNTPSHIVSSTSSRGPSQCGGAYEMKPEVSAPGEDVVSVAPGGGYAYMSGTSMAGPHVAGVVALMREANPDLDVTDIKEILMETAIDIDVPGEDNNTGFGMIDAYEAVLASLSDLGTVRGVVTDAATGLPLVGVEVSRPRRTSTYTDEIGAFEVKMRAAEVTFSFHQYGYEDQVLPILVLSDEVVDLNVALTPLPSAMISGTVTGPDGNPVGGAIVGAVNVPAQPVTADAGGYYELALPSHPDAYYELMASAQDLAYVVEHLGLSSDRIVDFQLPHIIGEGFESGGFHNFPWQMDGDEPFAIAADETFEGYFSAVSGLVGDGGTSQMGVDYYTAGAGEISFRIKVDTEANYDYLAFFVDGQARAIWSGQQEWTEYRTAVSSGQHNFIWAYFKDSAVAGGRDKVWIDRIEFPGTGVEPVPTLDLNSAPLTMALNPGLRDSMELLLGNVGGYRLDYTARILDLPVAKGTTAADLAGGSTADLLAQGRLLNPLKSAAAGWAAATPDTGLVQPGTVRSLVVHFDAADQGEGLYYGLLELQTNDPAGPVTTVPLIFTVGGVSDVIVDLAPVQPRLYGAVPNPFNPASTLTFELPQAQWVDLQIYDVAGRLVRNLVSGQRAAGHHRERWDGQDQAGRNVSSGVYYVRLTTGAHQEMKPMLLLR